MKIIILCFQGRIYRILGWEYRRPERVPPTCPFNNKPLSNNTTQKVIISFYVKLHEFQYLLVCFVLEYVYIIYIAVISRQQIIVTYKQIYNTLYVRIAFCKFTSLNLSYIVVQPREGENGEKRGYVMCYQCHSNILPSSNDIHYQFQLTNVRQNSELWVGLALGQYG